MPKIDRYCTDLQRIPGVIIDVSGGEQIQFYQVATTAGVIQTKFRTGDICLQWVCVSYYRQIPIHKRSFTSNSLIKQIYCQQMQMQGKM